MAVFTSGTSAGKASQSQQMVLLAKTYCCQETATVNFIWENSNKPGYLGEAKALRVHCMFSLKIKLVSCILYQKNIQMQFDLTKLTSMMPGRCCVVSKVLWRVLMCWYEDYLGAFACFYVVANFLRMGFFTNCVAIVVCSDFSAFLCGCLGFLGGVFMYLLSHSKWF